VRAENKMHMTYRRIMKTHGRQAVGMCRPTQRRGSWFCVVALTSQEVKFGRSTDHCNYDKPNILQTEQNIKHKYQQTEEQNLRLRMEETAFRYGV
jgi:hypothetical protein